MRFLKKISDETLTLNEYEVQSQNLNPIAKQYQLSKPQYHIFSNSIIDRHHFVYVCSRQNPWQISSRLQKKLQL